MTIKQRKAIGRIDRLMDHELSRAFEKSIEVSDKTVNEYVDTVKLVDGIKVVTKEVKRVHPKERVKGLNWTDFSIDSLTVSGAIGDLTFSSLSDSSMNIADGLDAVPQNDNKNIEG